MMETSTRPYYYTNGQHPSMAMLGLPTSVDVPDQRGLLLCLADKYIGEARMIAQDLAITFTEDAAKLRKYSKLMATGLTCLETVLNKVRLPCWKTNDEG